MRSRPPGDETHSGGGRQNCNRCPVELGGAGRRRASQRVECTPVVIDRARGAGGSWIARCSSAGPGRLPGQDSHDDGPPNHAPRPGSAAVSALRGRARPPRSRRRRHRADIRPAGTRQGGTLAPGSYWPPGQLPAREVRAAPVGRDRGEEIVAGRLRPVRSGRRGAAVDAAAGLGGRGVPHRRERRAAGGARHPAGTRAAARLEKRHPRRHRSRAHRPRAAGALRDCRSRLRTRAREAALPAVAAVEGLPHPHAAVGRAAPVRSAGGRRPGRRRCARTAPRAAAGAQRLSQQAASTCGRGAGAARQRHGTRGVGVAPGLVRAGASGGSPPAVRDRARSAGRPGGRDQEGAPLRTRSGRAQGALRALRAVAGRAPRRGG